MTYRQLSPEERYMLAALRRQGCNNAQIARPLGRNRSTVGRELRRNSTRSDGRYGFADAFNPNTGWVNPDVIGIDVGITLLSAENLRTGNVWRWFMANREITRAMDAVGLSRVGGRRTPR